ncbi:MAG: hypothetical protein US42_C0007G0024 [Candidatus Magasanikbacteria bacterium GW2011_GWC2_37_14]|uniref:S-layer domain-containing protein n=1 Tax=Candidatus Magasanikbacteria bacterium GW2011_GWC2_37_14 TaxID=1619046 RepID=A0A0G0G974_9BACT|nr:MAG: hypothetical protein US42_C0007G0024 [Candidatus Magasanikbacteria bacterium GW2011_GWC2_37_14]
MFDEPINTKNPSGIPGNLPVGEPVPFGQGEPEDMFSGVATEENEVTLEPGAGNSALAAGVLTPKVQPEVNNVEIPVSRPSFSAMPEETTPPIIKSTENYDLKEPVVTRVIITLLVIVLVVGGLGMGGWWAYNKYINSNQPAVVENNTADTTNNIDNNQIEANNNTVVNTGNENNTVTDIGSQITDDQVLFGEPIDKDGDGLDDTREVEIGTDPNNWDTDKDELSDGDEVIIWKTNPLNPDSDGDNYLDGAEVKNGYSPTGLGKIFELPETK